MDTKCNNLEYKMKLWKYFSDLRNHKEYSFATIRDIFAVIGIIVSAVNVIYSEKNDKIEWYLTINCVAMPMLIVVCLFWFSINNRTIAIIMGYIAGLEDSINMELEERIYQFDSYYVWLYSPKYFPSNNHFSIFYGLIIYILTFICFYRMYDTYYYNLIYIIFITIYFLIYIIFVMMLLIELNTNAKMRKISRAYFHLNVANKEIDEMDLKNFLGYIPNIDAMVQLYEINNE